jgi:hypothetical protein
LQAAQSDAITILYGTCSQSSGDKPVDISRVQSFWFSTVTFVLAFDKSPGKSNGSHHGPGRVAFGNNGGDYGIHTRPMWPILNQLPALYCLE